MIDPIDHSSESLRVRAKQIFEGFDDLPSILLILKTHFLLEELLNKAVRSNCTSPEYFDRANLRFSQLVNVARALLPVPTDNSFPSTQTPMLWDGIEALNTLRNRCAHRLDFTSDLAPILERLDIPGASRFTSWSDPDLFKELVRPVSVVLGAVTHGTRRREKYV